MTLPRLPLYGADVTSPAPEDERARPRVDPRLVRDTLAVVLVAAGVAALIAVAYTYGWRPGVIVTAAAALIVGVALGLDT